ncbi:hypothetical protein [Paraburkholderia bannensis]|uniref:hypothetical protein n=1 Tax=Paraburkholderia bannensis TaxID=765414 RepID=UPI002AB6D890|nr:hypothetical protein [Paraburkholderia bannensis]
MPNKPPSRLPAGHSKAMLLPMGRDRASDLILRTRLLLERALRGDIDRGLINHFAQVCILTGYVARAGYAKLPPGHVDAVEVELAQALIDFDETGVWGGLSDKLIAGLRDVVNEYDRMLGAVRLEVFAKASDYLDHLMARVANEKTGQTEPSAALAYTHRAAAPATHQVASSHA